MWMLPPSVTSAAARGVKSKICKKRRRKGQKKDGEKGEGKKRARWKKCNIAYKKEGAGPPPGTGEGRARSPPLAHLARGCVLIRAPLKFPCFTANREKRENDLQKFARK